MTLQLESAVSALKQGAHTRESGDLVQRRLSDVQSFLATELGEVDRAIHSMAADGIEPAVAAAEHLIGRGGKRVRSMALLLAAKCFSAAREARHFEMAAVVELAHSATLLHDDVVDEGMERRGAPTSRRIHGNAVSVLSGDLLLVNALARTAEHAPELLTDLIATLRRLVDGEVVQLKGRTELDLSEGTYLRILHDKTASLFAFATRSGAVMAGATPAQASALAEFGEHLGVAFQLVDDVIDYDGGDSGKTLFADLVEGKLTLPLVLAIQRDNSLADLVARIHAGDDSCVPEVSRRVVASGSLTEVRARAKARTEDAIGALERVPPSPARNLLEVVAREMTRRSA